MKNLLKKQLAWLTDQVLCLSVSLLTGVHPKSPRELTFNQHQKVYCANHGSHDNFVLVWISLPHHWRLSTRPVVGSDYWLTSKFERFIIQNVFDALLVPHHSDNPQAVTKQMRSALNADDSLIIFPGGTHNADDNIILLPFKPSIYHLAKSKPNTELVPIQIDNISRVLPRGKILPIPLLCEAHVEQPLTLQGNEDEGNFLTRSHEALLAFRPSENDHSKLRQNESEVQQNERGQA